MTDGQYRALVAYLRFWTPEHSNLNLDEAIKDIGITDARQQVIDEMDKAGWRFDEAKGRVSYSDAPESMWLITDLTGRFGPIVVGADDAEGARDAAHSYLDGPADPLEDLEFQGSKAAHLMDESKTTCVELALVEDDGPVWVAKSRA